MKPRLAAALAAGDGPLLGRERDLEYLRDLLRGGARLITLRGPGGIGKTALARQLARTVWGAYDQVEFVDLTTLRDPDGVLGVIAGALPGVPRTLDPLGRIGDFAAQGKTLLVLDNFEHLLPAAAQLGELIGAAGPLQLVVTSRSALHLHDEHEYPVGPLGLPGRARHSASSPAVQLFVTRVRTLRPSFELRADNRADVIRLCEVLEGVPLALELAAARLRTYALPELLARLEHPLGVLRADFRDRPERLRSLRAAVQWSYDLLEPGDRAVFECCAVFEGDFTPGALADVWGSADVLDRVDRLIEQVLALPAPADRQVLLRALEVSADALVATGQSRAREARLREVLALCQELGDVESAAWATLNLAQLASEAGRYAQAWQMQQEVLREYAARVRDRPPDRKQRMLHASALLNAAVCLLNLGKDDLALDHAVHAHQRYQEAGNSVFELESRIIMGLLMVRQHRLPEARSLLLGCLREAADRGFRGVADDALRWAFPALAAEVQDWAALVQFAAFVDDPAREHSRHAPDRQLRQDLARARAALGEVGFQAAWEAGTRLLLPDAVELAGRLAQEPRRSPPASPVDLTPREWEVLALVAQGHPDRRIAKLLDISPGTASKHVGNLLGKLGLHNRVELARWAIAQDRPESGSP